METLAKVDLGSLFLSIAIVLGLIGLVAFLIRLAQIPIGYYLAKKRNDEKREIVMSKDVEEKGF